MAKTDTQLTKQVGEYLVAAELARRGLLSATFAGSVRHYDVIASGPTGGHVPIQVKTINGGAWQLDIRDFVEEAMAATDRSSGRPNLHLTPTVLCLRRLQAYGSDRFFSWPMSTYEISSWTGTRGISPETVRFGQEPRSFHKA
jgi:hypothetical protein